MSGMTLRIFIAAVLFVQAIGHFMGLIPALQIANVKGWNSPAVGGRGAHVSV